MATGLARSGMTVETEVVAKARRRRFSAAENVQMLLEADGWREPGELSALLRCEELYASGVGRSEAAAPSPQSARYRDGQWSAICVLRGFGQCTSRFSVMVPKSTAKDLLL